LNVVPRVGRASQPWALGRNPVGIRRRPFRKLMGNAQLPEEDQVLGHAKRIVPLLGGDISRRRHGRLCACDSSTIPRLQEASSHRTPRNYRLRLGTVSGLRGSSHDVTLDAEGSYRNPNTRSEWVAPARDCTDLIPLTACVMAGLRTKVAVSAVIRRWFSIET
jgi:hypothetical protein